MNPDSIRNLLELIIQENERCMVEVMEISVDILSEFSLSKSSISKVEKIRNNLSKRLRYLRTNTEEIACTNVISEREDLHVQENDE